MIVDYLIQFRMVCSVSTLSLIHIYTLRSVGHEGVGQTAVDDSADELVGVQNAGIDHDGHSPVSYTHLDVYKRQAYTLLYTTCAGFAPNAGIMSLIMSDSCTRMVSPCKSSSPVTFSRV